MADPLKYPLTGRFRRLVSTCAWAAVLLVRTAAADHDAGPAPPVSRCIGFHSIADRSDPHFTAVQTTVPVSAPVAFTVGDLDGNGRRSVIFEADDHRLIITSISSNGSASNREIVHPPVTDPKRRLIAFADTDSQTEKIAWLSGSIVTVLRPAAPPTASRPAELDHWSITGDRMFAEGDARWRCASAGEMGLATRFLGACGNATTMCSECVTFDRFGRTSPHGYVWIDPPWQLAARADLDGDGRDEILLSTQALTGWHIYSQPRSPRPWASFPPQNRWKGSIVGDFNGDGLADIVVYGSVIGDAWIAISLGNFALERPFPWPFPPQVERSSIAAGDFNGDGIDDLVMAQPQNGSTLVTFAIASPSAVGSFPETIDGEELLPLPANEGDTPRKFTVELTPEAPEQRICGLRPGSYRVQIHGAGPLSYHRFIELPSHRDLSVATLGSAPSADPSEHGGLGLGTDRPGPYVCTGYLPFATPGWPKWGVTRTACPTGFAYYGTEEGTMPSAHDSFLLAACCPLPANDVLLDDTITAPEACPDGYVITGAAYSVELELSKPVDVRCTKVNSTRYLLGPPRRAKYYGNGYSGRAQAERLGNLDVPLAIRTALSRTNYATWDLEGCLGDPPGALLVKKGGRRCYDWSYRQLQYAGSPGDPPRGTPVVMFPECGELANVFDPGAGCLP